MNEWFEANRKQIRRWRRRYKVLKGVQKFFSILIAIANIAITVWQFYDKYLKDRIEQMTAEGAPS